MGIETLKVQIAGEKKHIAKLEDGIAKLQNQIKELQQADEEAIQQREKGRDVFAQTESDFKATIKSIAGAVKGLEASDGTFLAQRFATPQLNRALALAEMSGVREEQRAA